MNLKINLAVLIFLFWGSIPSFATCYCRCSAFKTSGGERKICLTQPALTKGKNGVCKDWLFEVPKGTDEASCKDLGEEENPCHGYFQDPRLGDRWMDAFDGRYHSCQWR